VTDQYNPKDVYITFNGIEIKGFTDGTFIEAPRHLEHVPVNGRYHGTITMIHTHAWSPIEGERARYSCPCGVQGRRDLRTGEIGLVAHKHRVREVQPTAYPKATMPLGEGSGMVCKIDTEKL
jgi:hypothetical protein